MSEIRRPLPRPSAITKPFWDGTRHRKIMVQQCSLCHETQHPPRPTCLNCWSDSLGWLECSGEGVVYTYTVCHWATVPAFKAKTPYAVAMVDLPEGVRLTTALVGCDPGAVKVGMRVIAEFEDVDDTTTLLNFRPA